MSNHDMKIQELVDEIERGEIRLPEMQRQYVWQKTRVRDLLDSLYRGYPSGTILTWETSESVATRDFAVKQAEETHSSYQLLLDGQQRLTSLSAILRGEPVHVRDRRHPIDILFNLEHPEDMEVVTEVNENLGDSTGDDEPADEEAPDASEDELLTRFNNMAFVVHTKKLAALPQWVSVAGVFQGATDRDLLEKAGVKSLDDPKYGQYTSRLKRLRDIKNYIYRVHKLDHKLSYEEVTEIFVRVNSLGAKLRSSDLALAQITAKWRDSLGVIQQFEDQCKQKGFDLGIAILLRNLVCFATGQSKFRAVRSLTKERLQDAWEQAKEGMEFALNFICSNSNIDSPALLSSPYLVISVAHYCQQRDYRLTSEEERLLKYWLLVANAKARYSRGSSETFLDQDLSVIKKSGGIEGIRSLLSLLQAQAGRLEISPNDLKNRDSRSAYFKTMFLAFRADGAKDWLTQLEISLKHSGNQHKLQFHHIFPKGILKDRNLTQQEVNDICNLSFISGRTNRKISDKEPEQYLREIQEPDLLAKQCIPVDPQYWRLDSYSQFIDKRRQLVADRLNEFLDHAEVSLLLSRLPGKSCRPGPIWTDPGG